MLLPVTHHPLPKFFFFFFNDTATTEIYTLSLHDALPICVDHIGQAVGRDFNLRIGTGFARQVRSEEHTSELQSPCNLVCRLLLEKKKEISIDMQFSHVPFPASTDRTSHAIDYYLALGGRK